jgi:hypothetical protein
VIIDGEQDGWNSKSVESSQEVVLAGRDREAAPHMAAARLPENEEGGKKGRVEDTGTSA